MLPFWPFFCQKEKEKKVASHCGDHWSSFLVQVGVMPNYNSITKFGDIAVLLLNNTSTATPVAMAGPSTAFNQTPTLTVVGWGQTQDGEFPVSLQRVALPTMTNESCSVAHSPMGEIPEDHFCVGEFIYLCCACNLAADHHFFCFLIFSSFFLELVRSFNHFVS